MMSKIPRVFLQESKILFPLPHRQRFETVYRLQKAGASGGPTGAILIPAGISGPQYVCRYAVTKVTEVVPILVKKAQNAGIRPKLSSFTGSTGI